jgi:hypothetical protein
MCALCETLGVKLETKQHKCVKYTKATWFFQFVDSWLVFLKEHLMPRLISILKLWQTKDFWVPYPKVSFVIK